MQNVTIGYIKLRGARAAARFRSSNARLPIAASPARKLGIEDNNTTGQFTKQHYELRDAAVSDQQQALDALGGFAAEGVRFVVADLPAEMLLAVADKAAESDILVFNAGATDDVLRMEECRANVIHIAPSRAMLADALAQYLVAKKWTRWFLIVGSHPADEAYAAAVRRAASRFGAEIVEERIFQDTGGARTTELGPRSNRSADGRLHPVRAGSSRRCRRRRERGVRALRAVSHLDAGAGRRDFRPPPDKLGACRTTNGARSSCRTASSTSSSAG